MLHLIQSYTVTSRWSSTKILQSKKITLSLKPVVGAELDRLEKEQVLEKVTHSDLATPLVVVRKPGGKVRLCGDFKVTLNPALKTDVYPFPLPEELFQKLNGGSQVFKARPSRGIFTDSTG